MLRLLSKGIIGLIKAYKLIISPILPMACRYTPTCSSYGIEAIQKHGPVKGTFLAVKRILRCNPWGGSGIDPVPD
jgi:putative membrane protein insertion efficiency factor